MIISRTPFRISLFGGGGFMLIYVDPAAHVKIKKSLKNFLCVPFDFDTEGSQIIYDGGNGLEKSYFS